MSSFFTTPTMDDHDNEQYHIAWILNSFNYHEVVTQFFDDTFDLTPSTSTSSEIAYTRGRIGPHYVVVASTSHDSQSSSGDIADSLLEAFPYIRVGFLVSENATVPQHKSIQVGDVVLGIGSGGRAGVVHFDHQETTNQNRLFMTSELLHIPGTVLLALLAFRSDDGHKKWLRCLEQHGSNPRRKPRSFTGLIASSEQPLNDPALMKDIATVNDVLCFETAAANMKSCPFVVVSGIRSCSGDDQEKLPSNEVCKIIASYICCLVRSIEQTKLADEHPIADYFEYERFDLDRPGFRLLRLEGGIGEIKCHVFQAYLDDKDLIPYEALSYCWGSNRLTNKVKANGKDMFVTDSLFEALGHLRARDGDQIFWIDAICIDQSNIRERGHQVERMGQIYNCAERVRIWLGHVNEPGTKHLMAALQNFDQKVPGEAWRTWSYDDDHKWSGIWRDQAHSPQEQDGQKAGLEQLMRQHWFRRVWILQEVANAKTATVECNQGSINARSFALAPKLLEVVPNVQCQAIMDMMPGPSRRSSRRLKKQNLCTLLWKFRESEATEPRDKLFALLSLISDDDITGKITADYTKTERAIVQDIAVYLFGENTFDVRDIADLQRKLPNLSCMVLERMVLGGAQVKDIQEFMQRQNAPFWLSERTIAYAHYFNKSLMDHLSTPDAFEYVAGCPVLEEPMLEGRETVKSFLGERKHAKITQDTIELSRKKGIELVVSVLEQNRDDIEITEPLARQAILNGLKVFKRLLDKRGKDVPITESLLEDVIRKGPAMVKALLSIRGKDVPITKSLLVDVIREGPSMFKALFDMQGKDVPITELLLEDAIREGPAMVKAFLSIRGKDVHITESLLEDVIRAGPAMVETFLSIREKDVRITESLLEGIIREGPAMVKALFDMQEKGIPITESLLEDVIREGPAMVKALLDMQEKDVPITEPLLEDVIRAGLDMVKAFLGI